MYLLDKLLENNNLLITLHNTLDDYNIYRLFINIDIDLGEAINSPLRYTDDFPSFVLYIPQRIPDLRENAIWYKDLGDGDYGDVYKFVKKFAKFHLGIELKGKIDVAQYILSILGSEQIKYNFNYQPKLVEHIYYKSRPFTSKDLEYWAGLDQTEEDLNFWKVKSVKYLTNAEGVVYKEFFKRDLAFIYQIQDKEKFYGPHFDKSKKFRNSCPGDDYLYYQGYEYLRGKKEDVKILIITKSQKDVMVFYKYFNSFLHIPVDVVAPHAESIKLNLEFVEIIKNNYEYICVVADFDLAGIKFVQSCKQHGFAYKFISTNRININGKLKVLNKDISDFRMNTSKAETKKLLKSWNFQKFYLNQSKI